MSSPRTPYPLYTPTEPPFARTHIVPDSDVSFSGRSSFPSAATFGCGGMSMCTIWCIVSIAILLLYMFNPRKDFPCYCGEPEEKEPPATIGCGGALLYFLIIVVVVYMIGRSLDTV